MINRDGKLLIFENFVSIIRKENNIESGGIFIGNNIGNSIINGVGVINRTDDVMLFEYLEYRYSQNATIINWLKLKLVNLLSVKNKKVKGKIKYQLIDDFFNNIKKSVKNLDIDESSVDFYITAIKNAVENDQIALSEILANKNQTLISELRILKQGIIKYVTENDIVNFYNLVENGEKCLKLTWIKNYVRVIPQDVLDIKYKYNDLFDNFVVLHFDINGESESMTEKEKEKAKDPILFGVLKNSRKLYYIGDWIDEYCDLTLDKFIETLEQEKPKELTKEIIEKEILNGSNI